MYKNKASLRICAMVIAIIILMNPVSVASGAGNMTRASIYLDSYSVYPSSAGAGRVHFYWDVWGTDYWDLGVKSIKVYESINGVDWTLVKTYTSDIYRNMIAENVIYHYSNVTYYGIAGRYYKAYVCVWGGDIESGYGDSRYFWTNVVKG